MTNIVLSKFIYSHYPDPHYQKPKADYVPYFEDMQRFSQAYLDREMLTQKSGYSFFELIEMAIRDHPSLLSALLQVELIIFTHSCYEYDSLYSHVGPALAEKYHLHAELLDVIEEGDLSIETAEHVLSAYFAQENIKSGLIIGLEQHVMPLRSNKNTQLPKCSSVNVLLYNASSV